MTNRSWKTTVCGVLTLLGTLVAQFYPEHAKHGLFLASFASGLGLLLARDNDKTSEQVKAGKPILDGASAVITLLILAVVVISTGCARFKSSMVQTRLDGTKVESKQSITTFWDSQSSVAKLRASTTDKTQGLTVGGIEQDAGGVTNIAEQAGAMLGTALRYAVPAPVPR